MDTIGVQLQAKGNIASEAAKAAGAMADLAKQEAKVKAVAKSLGTKDIKAVGKALNTVAVSEKRALSKKMAEEKKAFARETKYAKQDLGFLTKDKELQDKILKVLGPETAGALAGGIELAAGFGAAIAVGAVAATALAVAIGTVAYSAGKARNSAKQLIDTLTGGNGAAALALIDKQSKALGVTLQQGRDDFVAFRQAGLDNKQSAALEKLRADLDAVDPSGKQAAEAMAKVLDMKGAKGTANEIAYLAKQAHVAGDGATAAAKNYATLGGALNRLDNTKTQVLEKIFDKISPSIDRAASSIATFVEAFANSAKGQKVIDGISTAISGMADIAASAIPTVASVLGTLVDVGTRVYSAYQSVAEVFRTNATAGALAAAALGGLKVIGYVLVGALAAVAAGGLLLVAPFLAAGAAIAVVTGAVANGLSALWGLVASVPKIGSAIIDGFIGGLTAGATRLGKAVSGLASTVSGGFSHALGINSPSKVFAEFGKHTATGYEQGVERHMPTGKDFASSVSPGGSAAPVPSPGAATSGGDLNVNIEQMIVPVGVDPEPFARAVRREITLMLQMIQLSRGGLVPGAV